MPDLNQRLLPCEGAFGFFRVIPIVAIVFVSLYYATNRFKNPIPAQSVHFRDFHV